ncbi:MAG: aminoacyl-tRNA hydrolase [Desulfosalsimonas sp.]|uniref:aminoacyl-tRNA hydrolase n=1 Tax=Desulfosalsimonas sp. TaxID=3073848 RepID=UPI003970E40E
MQAEPWLIAGLGNPGRLYARTRHNIGFRAVENASEKCGVAMDQTRFRARFGRGLCGSRKVIFAQPLDYMNRSGPPLRRLADYFGIKTGQMLVIHDDLDIEKGQIKFKEKGGHGGHNGIKSIMEAFSSGGFPRLRIGIGRPAAPMDVTGWVLGKFTAEEQRFFGPVIESAGLAVLTMIDEGLPVAMNRFNQKQVL